MPVNSVYDHVQYELNQVKEQYDLKFAAIEEK